MSHTLLHRNVVLKDYVTLEDTGRGTFEVVWLSTSIPVTRG